MTRYVYAFTLAQEIDGEVIISFPRISNIISAIRPDEFMRMTADKIAIQAEDALLTHFHFAMQNRQELPRPGILSVADGVVALTVLQSIKVELYNFYIKRFPSLAKFATEIRRQQTATRRLLDLKHQSRIAELEDAFAVFGLQLSHDWALEPIPPLRRLDLKRLTAAIEPASV